MVDRAVLVHDFLLWGHGLPQMHNLHAFWQTVLYVLLYLCGGGGWAPAPRHRYFTKWPVCVLGVTEKQRVGHSEKNNDVNKCHTGY